MRFVGNFLQVCAFVLTFLTIIWAVGTYQEKMVCLHSRKYAGMSLRLSPEAVFSYINTESHLCNGVGSKILILEFSNFSSWMWTIFANDVRALFLSCS